MKSKNVKTYVQYFTLVLVVIFIVFILVQNSLLNQKIKNLIKDYDHAKLEMEQMQNSIDEIYRNVEEQLRKQASLFSSITYQFGDLHKESGTVDMHLALIPKTVVSEILLSVKFDDQVIVFEKDESNTYHATVSVPLFFEGEGPLIMMETEEKIQTELLDYLEVQNLWTHYLPSAHVDVEGRANYNQASNSLKMNASLTVKYKIAERYGANFENMQIVVKTNNGEIAREDITNIIKSDKDKITVGTYTAPFDDTFTVGLKEDFYVYLVATDSMGYRHEYLAYHWLRNTDNLTPDLLAIEEQIYDANGNLLVSGKK
ncbi:MAG: hypothetical protein E7603_04740 [Ruminococcaceae bacterium]|nr:hypothetical protein [Oscillospiraceae bacterium]